jgi:hypothetical protein
MRREEEVVAYDFDSVRAELVADDEMTVRLHACKKCYDRNREKMVDDLTDALVITYEGITGRKATDKVREDLWQAIRFE